MSDSKLQQNKIQFVMLSQINGKCYRISGANKAN